MKAKKHSSGNAPLPLNPMLLLWLLPLAFLGVFYFYPLGNILQLSLFWDDQNALAAFWSSLTSAAAGNALKFTFQQAALSTLFTLILGLPGAYLFARYQFKGKSMFRALMGVPFVMPTLVVAAGFNALLGPNGWVNSLLIELFGFSSPPIHFINTFPAIIIAHVFYNTTIVLRLVGDFWSHLNPRLNDASRVLGASPWKTFRTITLPLLSPAIAAASLLVFIFDFTSFGVVLILGGPQFSTLEVEIYYQTISLFNLPMAATLSLLQLACTLLLTIAYTQLSKRMSRALPLSARGRTQKTLRSWKEKLLAGLLILFLLSFLTLPLAALASRSLIDLSTPSGSPPRLTTTFYQALTRQPQQALFYTPPIFALRTSLLYAGITVLLGLALGLPAAWALSREDSSPLNQILDPLIMLPLGTSAVTLGLGFIVSLDRPPLNLRTSPLLLPLAHTLVAFPFVVRSLTPALKSIQPRLHRAAAVLGASPFQVFRQIDLPLIGRALIVSASFAFMISIGEFGASSLITRPENPTVPVVIYRFLSRPGALNYGQAMALSTILMLATLISMLTMEHFRMGDIGEF
ncbi:MAG: iron ABC transporter permease [Anaerolineales bacterium]|nr:iron ABC transporter permease [Anaerolineales bacterium]